MKEDRSPASWWKTNGIIVPPCETTSPTPRIFDKQIRIDNPMPGGENAAKFGRIWAVEHRYSKLAFLTKRGIMDIRFGFWRARAWL